jgi:hypothetical protein
VGTDEGDAEAGGGAAAGSEPGTSTVVPQYWHLSRRSPGLAARVALH